MQKITQPPAPKTIVLTGGGTAGHVLPHFALLPHIEKHFDRIIYAGRTHGIERDLIEKHNTTAHTEIKYHGITAVKLRRSFDLRNLSIPFKLIKGMSEAKTLLKQIKPDIVFSKGGFVAYPVVRAAARLKIPVIAHESDMTMGLANRLSAKHCTKICTTFEQTARTNSKTSKFIHTGSPIRAGIYNGNAAAVAHDNLTAEKRNLLITGGSQGAQNINNAILSALNELLPIYNIIHICGKGKKRDVNSPLNYIQLEYADNIGDYFAWADIVVSRAGSNALCELIALGKPTLFIPLSRAASRGDQIQNADFVKSKNAAEVLPEENLTPETLLSAINKVYQNRQTYIKNAAKLSLDGTAKIANIIKVTNNR